MNFVLKMMNFALILMRFEAPSYVIGLYDVILSGHAQVFI